MSEKLDVLIDDALELIGAYDEAYEEGMDHEQGFDFACSMRDWIIDLVAALRGRG